MTDDRKPPAAKPPIATPFPGGNKRPITSADRDVRVPFVPPRGVGLTRAPSAIEPREVNFESKTPIGTEPEVWRALREFRKQTNEAHEAIKIDVTCLKSNVTELDKKVDGVLINHGETMGKLEILVEDRNDQRLARERAAIEAARWSRFWRHAWLKVIGGVFSAGVLVELVKWLVERYR